MKGIIEFLANENWTLFFEFFALNFVYVVVNTVHTILCMKAKNKWVGSIAGAVCYGYYTIVLKAIMGCDNFTTVTCTVITNILGGYVAWLVAPLFMGRPCQSYKFTLNVIDYNNNIVQDILEDNDISYHYVKCESRHSDYLKYTVYTRDKKQDEIIDTMLKNLNIGHNHKEEY